LLLFYYFALKACHKYFFYSEADVVDNQTVLYFLCHEEILIFGVESKEIIDRIDIDIERGCYF
jgi:hypothetical protein